MLSHLKSINTAQIWLATLIVMLGIVFNQLWTVIMFDLESHEI